MKLTRKLLLIGIGCLLFFEVFSMQIINTLPSPTGQYQVGTVTYHLIDKTRQEKHVADPEHPYRELVVQLWYPGTVTNKKKSQPYVSERLAEFIRAHAHTRKGWFTGSGYVGETVKTNSYANIPIVAENKSYPVILFSHGFGCPAHIYTSLFEELASRGFIVVAINHTYYADPVEFPDGRITQFVALPNSKPKDSKDVSSYEQSHIWREDIRFVLDEIEQINMQDPHNILTGGFDLENIGIMGHSFGATNAFLMGHKDVRLKAVIAIDGFINTNSFNESYLKPIMVMYNTEQGTFTNEDVYTPKMDLTTILAQMRQEVKKFCENAAQDSYEVQCKAHHMTFSDYFLITQSAKQQDVEMQNLKTVKSLIVDFFSVYLKGKESTNLLQKSDNPQITVKYRKRK